MLHIRNTLHKNKYLENCTRVILHLEHLPLQETAVFTQNRGVPKIAFSPSFFYNQSLPRNTSYNL